MSPFTINEINTYTQIKNRHSVWSENDSIGLAKIINDGYEAGRLNFLIDMEGVQNLNENHLIEFKNLQESSLEKGFTIVYQNISAALETQFKNAEIYEILNIAPTEQEALDIFNMDALSRNWFDEEEV